MPTFVLVLRKKATTDSAVIDFLGHPVSECGDEDVVVTVTLQAKEVAAHRERFPAMLDGDAFTLS